MYLFRALDSHGLTVEFYLSETRDREAAKLFLERALANPDNRTPQVSRETDCAVTQRPFVSCKGWSGETGVPRTDAVLLQ